MSSDEDEKPPKTLLAPITLDENNSNSVSNFIPRKDQRTTITKPYRVTFTSREAEVRYIDKIMDNCEIYDGNPVTLANWIRQTGAFIVKERIPETDHPFFLRHLLINEAMAFYQLHEEEIFSIYDFGKLFQQGNNTLSSIPSVTLAEASSASVLQNIPSLLTSTRLPETNDRSQATSNLAASYLNLSLDDITQNDIRRSILEELQRNFVKFTGERQQDVIKWLANLEKKFDIGDISDRKKFDLIGQVLDKGALDWFLENKERFNRSWKAFAADFKQTFELSNRSYLALLKLQSYEQAPQQDVRSFCREMHQLFQEADPQMSNHMQLSFLLAKVKPSYRLAIVEKGPSNFQDFERIALVLEKNYALVETFDQTRNQNISWSTHQYDHNYRQNSDRDFRPSSANHTPSYFRRATERQNGRNFSRATFRNETYNNRWRPSVAVQHQSNRGVGTIQRGYPSNKVFTYQPALSSEAPNQRVENNYQETTSEGSNTERTPVPPQVNQHFQ